MSDYIKVQPGLKDKDWEAIYKHVKSMDFNDIEENKNPLNSLILANAPHKIIKYMIENAPKSLLTDKRGFSGNTVLHFLLGTPEFNDGTKKEIDHALVRLVLKKSPESFFMRNAKNHIPIDVLRSENYSELRLITEEILLNFHDEMYKEMFFVLFERLNMPILEKVQLDALKFIEKNKSRIIQYKTLKLALNQLTDIIVEQKTQQLQVNNKAKQLIEQEEREKLKAIKRKEIEEKVRLAKLEQERKEIEREIKKKNAVVFIQQRYRFKNKLRNARKHGINPGARPYQPPKHLLETLPRSIDEFTIEDNLPLHNEISNPWRYTKEYPGNFPVFRFGKSNGLFKLYADLKKINSIL